MKSFLIYSLFAVLACLPSSGCSERRYALDTVIGVGVAGPADLPSLLRKADRVERELSALGFKCIVLTDSDRERLVRFKGDYENLTDLTISISCLKEPATERSEFRVRILSPGYRTETHLPEGDKLKAEIQRAMKDCEPEDARDG